MSREPPEPEEPFPEVLTRAELGFEISFALQQVTKPTGWEWARTDRLKKNAARERIIDTITVRFDRLQVRGPAHENSGLHLVGANTRGPGGRNS